MRVTRGVEMTSRPCVLDDLTGQETDIDEPQYGEFQNVASADSANRDIGPETGASHYEQLTNPAQREDHNPSEKFKSVHVDQSRQQSNVNKVKPLQKPYASSSLKSGKTAHAPSETKVAEHKLSSQRQTAQIHPVPSQKTHSMAPSLSTQQASCSQTKPCAKTDSSEKSSPPLPQVIERTPKPLSAIPETNCWMSILTLMCLNPVFGCFAVYFSLRSAAAYRDGYKKKGARSAFIAIVISLVGISITMVVLSVGMGWCVMNKFECDKITKPGRTGSFNPLNL